MGGAGGPRARPAGRERGRSTAAGNHSRTLRPRTTASNHATDMMWRLKKLADPPAVADATETLRAGRRIRLDGSGARSRSPPTRVTRKTQKDPAGHVVLDRALAS